MTKKMLKNSFNTTNITDDYTRKQVENGAAGFFCGINKEKIPQFDKAPCETKYEGLNNSFIILGRDRNATFASGCGGLGKVQAGMIDLVAGRGQLVIAENIKKNKKDPLEGAGFVGPMFHSDAARVYITQKCIDIDKYFGLAPSKGRTSEQKSAVALKADQIRIIGREKVRIYCGGGNFNGFETGIGETNCLGQSLGSGVIELQVGQQELHPVVLGNKLVDYLKSANKKQKKIYQMLNTVALNVAVLNSICSAIPGAALMITPFTKQQIEHSIDTISNVLNTYIDEMNALDNDLVPGANNILSNSVYTT